MQAITNYNNWTQKNGNEIYSYQRKNFYPKKKTRSFIPVVHRQLPTHHPMDIYCFQECAVWTLNLASLINKSVCDKGLFYTKAVPLQSSDLMKAGRLSSNLKELFPIDLRDNQRFVLDKNQPKMYLNIDFDLFSLDEEKSFSVVNKEYSSLIFEIDLHASLHQNKMFKESINFKVKGFDIIKSIQGKLNELARQGADCLSVSTKEGGNSNMIYGATVFNNIQCSFGIDFSISNGNLIRYSESNYHNNASIWIYDIKIVKMKITYSLPLCIFNVKNNSNSINNKQLMMSSMRDNYCFTSSQIQQKQIIMNFCNWHSFMSTTTPIIFETEDIMIKDIFNAFIKPSLFGVNCLYRIDHQHFTQVAYYPTLSQAYIEANGNVNNSKSININNCNKSRRQSITISITNPNSNPNPNLNPSTGNINQLNTNGNNDSSTLDGSFITSISSIAEEKCPISKANYNSNNRAIRYKERIAELYRIKSYSIQIQQLLNEHSETEEMTLGEISSDSWFSLIWRPIKSPQMKSSTPGMQFVESTNFSAFEVFYHFRSYTLSNTGHYIEVIGIQEKNIKGFNIDSMNSVSDYFWFHNKAINANHYYFEQDLYKNKNEFYYLKERAVDLEV